MALSDWINPFNRVTDIIKEAVTDKDKLNQLNFELENLKQQVYVAELNTKTIPWIDGLHKMGRQILSLLSIAAGFFLAYKGIDIDFETAALIGGPGSAYILSKGKGK